jgi:uncharacterized protein
MSQAVEQKCENNRIHMRVITLEEHYRSKYSHEIDDPYYARFNYGLGPLGDRLSDIGAGRVADMDKNGIDLQVLSHTVPSPEVLPAERAIPLCQRVNDELAEAVAHYPQRFAAFASLPIADPKAAARELERAVRELGFRGTMISGVTHGRFLDDPFFFPILECAESLDVPIYLHPAPPPEKVFDTYFAGLKPGVSLILSTAGWGWHSETAIHTLRLIAAGTFDRFPRLQFIIGHMGEMIPFQLARVDRALGRAAKNLRQNPAAYFQSNIHITTSGLFTTPPLQLALQVLGADRVMFSIDYPYSGNEVGRAFLDSLSLPSADFDKLTHQNAERLLKLT